MSAASAAEVAPHCQVTRWPAVPAKVIVASWPTTVVVTATDGPPIVAATVGLAGTSVIAVRLTEPVGRGR